MMNGLEKLAENAVVVNKSYFDMVHRATGRTYIAGPVSNSQIETAERSLGVTFAGEYRSFLSTCGSLMTEGLELIGVTPYETDEAPFFF